MSEISEVSSITPVEAGSEKKFSDFRYFCVDVTTAIH